MGWLDETLDAIRIAQYGTQPRPLTDNDRQNWVNAAQAEPRPQLPRTRDAVRHSLMMVNPIRFKQVEGDVKWIKKHLKRMGLNPETWKDYM